MTSYLPVRRNDATCARVISNDSLLQGNTVLSRVHAISASLSQTEQCLPDVIGIPKFRYAERGNLPETGPHDTSMIFIGCEYDQRMQQLNIILTRSRVSSRLRNNRTDGL